MWRNALFSRRKNAPIKDWFRRNNRFVSNKFIEKNNPLFYLNLFIILLNYDFILNIFKTKLTIINYQGNSPNGSFFGVSGGSVYLAGEEVLL